MDHPAELQDGDEVTVTAASKALNVGERGIYDGKVVYSKAPPRRLAIGGGGPPRIRKPLPL